MVVAIDGPGGVGKSTVAGAVAKALDLPHLDTGATYRAAALAVLRRGGDPSDPAAVLESIDGVELSFDGAAVMLNGEDVTTEIRSEAATEASSVVARHPEVRERIVALQRSWVASGQTLSSSLPAAAQSAATATPARRATTPSPGSWCSP